MQSNSARMLKCRTMDRPEAILLLGPTGSGKTPLGDLVQARGLWGRRCSHFDFGRHLRAVADGTLRPPGVGDADAAFLRDVLDRGALLEDDQFPLAEKILRFHLDQAALGPGERVVLNGLPRHAGQARDVETLVQVVAVVELACTPQVVIQRIRSDAGGDRAGRADDDAQAVRNKLEIYQRRIAPLAEFYRGRGAAVHAVQVGPTDRAEDVWQRLSAT